MSAHRLLYAQSYSYLVSADRNGLTAAALRGIWAEVLTLTRTCSYAACEMTIKLRLLRRSSETGIRALRPLV